MLLFLEENIRRKTKLVNRVIYYTDSTGKKHEIELFKNTLSFPNPTEEEVEAVIKEFLLSFNFANPTVNDVLQFQEHLELFAKKHDLLIAEGCIDCGMKNFIINNSTATRICLCACDTKYRDPYISAMKWGWTDEEPEIEYIEVEAFFKELEQEES